MKRTPYKLPTNCDYFASQHEMPAELNSRLRWFAREFGETYASYLATETNREYFWGSCRRGVVAFCRNGRYVIVADGLLTASEHRERLLKEFLAFAARNRWRVSFLNVPRSEINLFRKNECQVTKLGEEPIVRLQESDWRGAGLQWIRRQESYCKRQGVTARECASDELDEEFESEIIPSIDEISREHIRGTLHRNELSFFVSEFDVKELRDRRLFVAEQNARIIAFIVCNPAVGGDMWAVEVYRRRRESVRGVIPFLIMHAMRRMKEEGVQYFSLSLAPFLRCTPVANDSGTFRWFVNFWWKRLNSIYDVQGIYHFKSRFRPDYRELFLASKPDVSIGAMIAMGRMWKLFRFNPLRLSLRYLHRKKTAENRSLPMPGNRGDRVIRNLRRKSVATAAEFESQPESLQPQNEASPNQLHEKLQL